MPLLHPVTTFGRQCLLMPWYSARLGCVGLTCGRHPEAKTSRQTRSTRVHEQTEGYRSCMLRFLWEARLCGQHQGVEKQVLGVRGLHFTKSNLGSTLDGALAGASSRRRINIWEVLNWKSKLPFVAFSGEQRKDNHSEGRSSQLCR